MDASIRARVMSRSEKLGHCVCDPRKSCPCDLLLEKDICLCAGERPPRQSGSVTEKIALTKLVKNAGCASKIPAADLSRILSRLPIVQNPRILVGIGTADDAGIFQVWPDLCLVQTVDVFSPCADDPYLFGQIAAANSVSDIYAMGGLPLTALSIIGYPLGKLGDEAMVAILKGGMEKLKEAGVLLIGGHSINDEEIKFGFAVTGSINPARIVTNAGAQPGDLLILTKPLGTGVICFANQFGRASAEAVEAAGRSMAALNRAASEIMVRSGAHACTDVTGFGLLGHLRNVVGESGVTVELWSDSLPSIEGAIEYAREGMLSGAAERNREFASPIVSAADSVPEYLLDLMYDPQTSGGLLISLPEEKVRRALSELRSSGCPDAAIIGRVLEKSKGRIVVKKADVSQAARLKRRSEVNTGCCSDSQPSGGSACCCSTPAASSEPVGCCCHEPQPPESGATDTGRAFDQFMSSAFATGALSALQKEIITISLAVAVQCEQCLKTHLEKARSLGATPDQLEEAAWLGIVFGGCKAMMFWKKKFAETDSSPARLTSVCAENAAENILSATFYSVLRLINME